MVDSHTIRQVFPVHPSSFTRTDLRWGTAAHVEFVAEHRWRQPSYCVVPGFAVVFDVLIGDVQPAPSGLNMEHHSPEGDLR
jgi:hypothetical protein